MADVDEDQIRVVPADRKAADDPASDEEDNAQDYAHVAANNGLPYDPACLDSLLESLEEISVTSLRSSPTDAQGQLIPRRGEKDFEPHPTDAQAQLLAKSRAAMHTALSHGRTHAPRTRVLGVYDERCNRVVVRKRRGVWLSSAGLDRRGGMVELRPEEALWAIEGGRMDARYRDQDVEPDPDWTEEQLDAHEDSLLPMSLQGAYAALLGSNESIESGLTLEKYVVYSGLKRAGFTVTRAEGFSGLKATPWRRPSDHEQLAAEPQTPTLLRNPFSWLYWVLVGQAAEAAERERRKIGPLVKPGLYSNYQDMFRSLELIGTKSPLDTIHRSFEWQQSRSVEGKDESEQQHRVKTPYTTTFNIWQPAQAYKKRNPPQPAFRVCVVSARETLFPTLDELDQLLSEQPPDLTRNPTRDPQDGKKKRNIGQTYAALKRGRVSVLLAVVDEGIVSYMRINEASFATEGRIFEREAQTERGKGGGRGRGRGRGRGSRGRGRG